MKEFFTNIPDFSLLNNTREDLLVFVSTFVILLIIFQLLKKVILKKLLNITEKTSTDLDTLFVDFLRNISLRYYIFVAFLISIRTLRIDSGLISAVSWIFLIWTTFLAVLLLQKVVNHFFLQKINRESGNAAQALSTLNTITKSLLWVVALLFILSNLGINITSVFAGLGIGGIAVALALQNILGDLFSSFAIYFDKPFEVGDFIVVGDKIGVVEKIGIKTTRIKALQGEEVVISNRELTTTHIQNFKKLQERRITFSFGVTYSTPNEKLELIKKIAEEGVGEVDGTRFDRCHFYRFEESSLFFEVVYFVDSPDYNVYMDMQEQFNLKLKEGLEKNGIQMAFPTRTVYLNRD